MRGLHENVKLVFLLRNPAERFWSSLRFNKTHNPAFDIDGNFSAFLARHDFAGFANYERTIQAALSHFTPDDLFMAFYENLFSDAEITRFCGWLGVPFAAGDYGLASNAAAGADMPDSKRREAVQAYAATYHAIHTRFGGQIPASWQADMNAYL